MSAPTGTGGQWLWAGLRDRIALAVYDPSAVVGARWGPGWDKGSPAYADSPESLWEWQIRAVMAVIEQDASQIAELDRLRAVLAGAVRERDEVRHQLNDALLWVPSRFQAVLREQWDARESAAPDGEIASGPCQQDGCDKPAVSWGVCDEHMPDDCGDLTRSADQVVQMLAELRPTAEVHAITVITEPTEEIDRA